MEAPCHPNKKHYARGLCHTCYMREWRRGKGLVLRQPGKRPADCHPDRPNASGGRCPACNNRFRKFGMTPDDYQEMLARQGGGCAICGTKTPGGVGGFHVDHDHDSGLVRALLCHGCNTGLGAFRDDPEILMRATEYLQAHAGFFRAS